MGQLSVLILYTYIFTSEAPAGSYDDRIKQKKNRRERKYNRHHTDQGASRHQHAQRRDDGNA
jgi:adenosyl cobinamide kinase/adenosyl cobinamide phosphate guanylyltransferase